MGNLELPYRADRDTTVLTIVQVLINKARALRHIAVPDGCCDYCYHHHGRGLYSDHCVCTGHINLRRKDIYTNSL